MNPRVTTITLVVTFALLIVTWGAAVRWHVEPDSLAIRATGERIDINTATVDELMLLPGIGPTAARRIVEYRQQHGPFSTVDELTKIERIGEVTVSRLREYVTVSQSQ